MAIFTKMLRSGKSVNIQVEDLFFILIFIIGAIFRCYHYADYTITNDELSGIVLSSGRNFHELYKSALLDGHPIGYIFFLHYWVQYFGDGLTLLRLPFILLGLASVILVYLIGCRWFGRFTALLAATCFSLLTFTVLYSQLARPYSPGLFFSLLAVYCWTWIIIPGRKSKATIVAYVGFVIFGWLAMTLHYFGMLAVGMAGLTGLVFVRGRELMYYVLCGLVMILLYLPFSGILIAHLNTSGLDWLGRPDSSFLLSFLQTIFNNDYLLLYLFILCILVLAWEARKRLRWKPFHTISLLFFVLPFIIAYVKSVLGKPVLQDRVLLFQLPYLLLFLCSFQGPNIRNARFLSFRNIVWGIFTLAAIYSFIFKVQYFKNGYNDYGNFKLVSKDVVKHYKEYGKRDVTWATSVNRPFYATYYTRWDYVEIPYSLLRCDDNQGLDSLMTVVQSTTTPYFYFWWCHNHYMPASKGVIRQKFPVILEDELQPRHGMSFFARDTAWGDTVFYSKNDMDSMPVAGWNDGILDSTNSFSGQRSSFMKGTLYGPSFTRSMKDAGIQHGDKVMIKAKVQGIMNGGDDALLVMETTGSNPQWKSMALKKYGVSKTGWTTVYFLNALEDEIQPGDQLKAYLYNPGEDILYIDDMEVIVYRKK